MEVEITIKKEEIIFFIEALKLHEDDFEAQQRDLDYFMSVIKQRIERKLRGASNKSIDCST